MRKLGFILILAFILSCQSKVEKKRLELKKILASDCNKKTAYGFSYFQVLEKLENPSGFEFAPIDSAKITQTGSTFIINSWVEIDSKRIKYSIKVVCDDKVWNVININILNDYD